MMETISKHKKAQFVDRVYGEINTFLQDVAAEFAPREYGLYLMRIGPYCIHRS